MQAVASEKSSAAKTPSRLVFLELFVKRRLIGIQRWEVESELHQFLVP